MATNEPMTDERLAEISARVKNAWKIQAVGPANTGDLEPWQLQSIAVAYVDDVADLLAEVERRRAREQALAAENAAMRPVVEAVAEFSGVITEDGSLGCQYCERWIGPNLPHADDCTVLAARTFVAAHPKAAGEAESEGE